MKKNNVKTTNKTWRIWISFINIVGYRLPFSNSVSVIVCQAICTNNDVVVLDSVQQETYVLEFIA